MDRIERALVAINRTFVALVLGAVFLLVFANGVGRYGFGHSISWSEEAARHLMVLGAFTGAGLALREGRLVAIMALPDLLPTALRGALRWGIVGVMAVFMGCVLWLGVEFVQFGWNKETMSTGMSRGIPYLALPIGAGLFLIQLGFFATRFVREEFESADEPLDGKA